MHLNLIRLMVRIRSLEMLVCFDFLLEKNG